MRSVTLLLATLSAVGNAHNDRGGHSSLPKLVGGSKFMANLKSRNLFTESVASVVQERAPRIAEAQVEGHAVDRCGPGVGSCDPGYCCSPSGYCGTTKEYCAAPDCQFRYGPACDANKRPAGVSTSTIARPKVGSIPYGGLNTGGVQVCNKPGKIAFTYDDGPYIWTKDLVDLLDSYGAKATFFITGNNLGKGSIDNCDTGYAQLIKRMYNSGHQIASHTWSHQDLSTLNTTELKNQMYYNEMAFRNILGVIPTYMRPPYSSCKQACADQLSDMGYHITYFDLDTQGYLHSTPDKIQTSKDIFSKAIKGQDPATKDYLLIEHDNHAQVVYNLTKFMLEEMQSTGWDPAVTVGECLNDPKANWYRPADAAIAPCAAGVYAGPAPTYVRPNRTASATSSSSATSRAPSTTPIAHNNSTVINSAISTDGACGRSSTGKLITCKDSTFGGCCSQYGYCGSTTGYCGTGCQFDFGDCGAVATPSNAATPPFGNGTVTAVSRDGACASGVTCSGSAFGECCSQYGWCGMTNGHCGTGCQQAYGNCSTVIS